MNKKAAESINYAQFSSYDLRSFYDFEDHMDSPEGTCDVRNSGVK